MTWYELTYSPFDALGVIPTSVSNKRDIFSAFKAACLHRHPDRGPEDLDRFPQMKHIHTAKEYLLAESNDLGPTVAYYRNWPQTFVSSEEKDPFREPVLGTEFVECKTCHMVMKPNSLTSHVGEHEQRKCNHCVKIVALSEFHAHLFNDHNRRICFVCSDEMAASLAKQHDEHHSCPFCPIKVAKNKLMQHLEGEHCLIRCPECPEYQDDSNLSILRRFIRHLNEYHKPVPCPVCQEDKILDQMRAHLEKDHGIVLCQKCNPSSNDFADLVKRTRHIKGPCPLCHESFTEEEMRLHFWKEHKLHYCVDCHSDVDLNHHLMNHHQWRECPACSCYIDEQARQDHLLGIHQWTECPHCDHLANGRAVMDEHVATHNLRKCMNCPSLIPDDEYRDHLRRVHTMKDCVFCTIEPLPLEQIREHIIDYHGHTEKCTVCCEYQEAGEMSQHLHEIHGWQKCLFCEGLFAESDMQTHIHEFHVLVACPECPEQIPEQGLNQHLISTHDYRLQRPTNNRSQENGQCIGNTPAPSGTVQTEDIIGETQGDSHVGGDPLQQKTPKKIEKKIRGKRDLCKDCNKEFANIYAHKKKKHGIQPTKDRNFKQERVPCVAGGGKYHSISNVSRCRECKEAKKARSR